MTGTPLVSIGLPVYNGERFLAQALDSLLGQTLGDLELIISDNASTDRTRAICLDYAARDTRIRYIRQPTNMGAMLNWNFVAGQARGQYFKWASANDFCDKRLLERCVSVLQADPSVVLCHGQTCMVAEEADEHALFIDDISAIDPRASERFRLVARTLKLNNALCGVMRLETLRRTPLIRPYMAGDVVLTIELTLYGRVVLVPEILFYRRFGPTTWSMQLDPTDLHTFLFSHSKQHLRFERWRRRVDLFRAVLHAPIGLPEKLRILLQAAHRAGQNLPAKARQWARRAVST